MYKKRSFVSLLTELEVLSPLGVIDLKILKNLLTHFQRGTLLENNVPIKKSPIFNLLHMKLGLGLGLLLKFRQ